MYINIFKSGFVKIRKFIHSLAIFVTIGSERHKYVEKKNVFENVCIQNRIMQNFISVKTRRM
jgi:hypothetical protein